MSTFAVAEQLYDALIVWKKQGSISVTATSLSFFRQFSSNIATGTYPSSSSTFSTLTSAIKSFADAFVALNAKYTPSNGGLAEQYDRNSGVPVSAVDLTWSYASALTAFGARAGVVSPSWGAANSKVPSTCSNGGTVSVTFNVQATTQFGGKFGVFSIRASSLTSGMQRTSTSRGPYLLCKIGRQTPLCSFRLQIIQFGVVCDVLDISEILDA